MFVTIIIIMLTVAIAVPIILGLTIVSLALGSMGVASIFPLGVIYYVFGGLLGILTGNGLQARRHIDAEARKFILGPFDWATHKIRFMWGSLFDFLLGPEPEPPRELPPRPPQALPPGGSPNSSTAQDMRDIEEILRKRGM